MGAPDGPNRRRDEPELHEIRVKGHLDDRWTDWVEGLAFTRERDGTTTITAPLADQAALHGLFDRLRDLNVPIVSVRRLCPAEEREGHPMRANARHTSGTPGTPGTPLASADTAGAPVAPTAGGTR